MKQSRLLEIIREEIAGALDEAATTYAGKTAIDDLKKDKAFGGLTGDAKSDAMEKLSSGGTVTIGEEKRKKLAEKYQIDEEVINEMASIKQLKSELERQGKENELKAVAAAERAALDTLKSDPTITPDGRLKGYVPTLKKELLNTHNIKLQDLLSQVAGKAEDDGVKFSSDIATNTIEKDAANQITGKEAGQRGRKATAEKPAKAEKKT
jgi:5'-3' exonuclease